MQQAAMQVKNNSLDNYVEYDIRCKECKHLLLKVVGGGSPKKVKIKCKNCKTINEIVI